MFWVLAVERAYVAAGTKQHHAHGGDAADVTRARAAVGAVASHYLAVAAPRTLGLVADASSIDDATLSVAAHRTWFQPREIRCAESSLLARAVGGVVTSLAEALACDIVCVHTAIAIRASQLRRGTHINILGATPATIDDDLRSLGTICEEARDLHALAAGLIDGRRLDELTVFIAGDLQIALGALHGLS